MANNVIVLKPGLNDGKSHGKSSEGAQTRTNTHARELNGVEGPKRRMTNAHSE